MILDEIKLIKTGTQKDTLGQPTGEETNRILLCQIGSISASEFFEAGRNGIKAQFRATIFPPDYEGELTAEYRGKRYGIYRTYLAKDDALELYLEAKAGA